MTICEGHCPKCGKKGYYRNIKKNIWFTCDTCGIKWWGGYGLFSSWQEETEDDWKRNWEALKDYEDVTNRREADSIPF